MFLGFPGGSDGKESTCNAGDPGLIPGSGRSPGEGKAIHSSIIGHPCGSAGKESACNAEDLGAIPGLGRSPGEGDSSILEYSPLQYSPLQYSCLGNPMDRKATVHGITKCDLATKQQ